MDNQHNENNDRSKIPTPLQTILIIIVSILFSFILMQVVLIPFIPHDPHVLETSDWIKIMLIVGELGLIILPFFYLKRKDFPIKEIFRWNAIDKNIVILIIAVGLSLSILGDELDRLINIIFTPPEFLRELQAMMKVTSVWDLFLLIVGAVIIAAVAEETIFRGLLQVSLEKHQNVTRAVIYSSLLWAIIHGLHWAIPIFLMGIVLGYLAWRTKSIIPPAICHGINNGLALLFNNVEGSGFYSFYEWKGHVSPLILIPAIFILVKGIRFLDRYYLIESPSLDKNGSE